MMNLLIALLVASAPLALDGFTAVTSKVMYCNEAPMYLTAYNQDGTDLSALELIIGEDEAGRLAFGLITDQSNELTHVYIGATQQMLTAEEATDRYPDGPCELLRMVGNTQL